VTERAREEERKREREKKRKRGGWGEREGGACVDIMQVCTLVQNPST